MKINLYAVMDEKEQAFKYRMFFPTHGVALRGFADSVRNKETALFHHPEDFSLYFLAVFDDESGYIEPVVPIQLLGRGSEYVQTNNKLMEARS